jgi:BCD family chlorophyll transporter-like MFS transporter
LLAGAVAPERRAAAAALTWIMMVAGIAISAAVAGSLLDPFTMTRLALVAGGIALTAFLLTLVAVAGMETRPATRSDTAETSFPDALRDIRTDPQAALFTLFVFVSMLSYSMQDLILEPFGGLVFGMTPGQTTSLAGLQHGGVLAGMLVAGVGGSAFRGAAGLQPWIAGGCLASSIALAGLVFGAVRPDWPLAVNVVLLGFANGLFAVAAIGAMMMLAGAGRKAGAGMRMGVWGAAQAIAFGLGGLLGAGTVDLARAVTGSAGQAFQIAFTGQAVLFLLAAWLALRAVPAARTPVAALAL